MYIPLIFLLAFSPLIEGGTTYLPVAIISLTTILACIYWLRQSLLNGEFLIPRTRLHTPILIFLSLSLFTTLWSPYKNMSLRWLIIVITYSLIFYLALYALRSIGRIRLIIFSVLILGAFQSAIGIIQYLWFNTERVHATFFNPNFLSGYLAAISPLCLGLLLSKKRGSEADNNFDIKGLKIVLSLTLLLLITAIFLTQSRGGAASLFIGASFVLWHKFRKRVLLILLPLILFILLIPNPVLQRIKNVSASDIYAYSRIEIWKSSLPRIIEHPIGYGLGIYKYTSQYYAFPVEEAIARYGKKAETAHNEYLQIAVELGIIGFITFLWGIFLVLKEGKSAIGILKVNNSGFLEGSVSGLLGGTIGILSHSLVDSNLHEPSIVILLITFVSTIIALNRIYGGDKEEIHKIEKKGGVFYDASLILISLLLTVIIIRPCIAYYTYSYGDKNLKKGDLNKAAGLFRWAIFFDPGNTTYHSSLSASTFYKFKEDRDPTLINEAISELNYAMKLNPIDAVIPNRLALVYHYLAVSANNPTEKEKLLREAEKKYKKSIQLSPFYANNYAQIGEIYLALGDKSQAKKEFAKALELEPRFLPARYKLALIYQEEGQIESAEAEYHTIIEIKEKYANKAEHTMEKQYLDVDIADVKNRLALLRVK